MRLVVASANPDKVAEMTALLEQVPGLELLPRPPAVPDVEETGATLVECARQKAEALVAATGEAAVADDTGLEVVALGGAPGVRTARFAGERASYRDNVDKLLRELAGMADRRARFVSIAFVALPEGREVWVEGSVDGTIAEAARGSGGFGYDPVFVPDGAGGRTFAELTPEEKSALSHRGRAFRALAARLTERV